MKYTIKRVMTDIFIIIGVLVILISSDIYYRNTNGINYGLIFMILMCVIPLKAIWCIPE